MGLEKRVIQEEGYFKNSYCSEVLPTPKIISTTTTTSTTTETETSTSTSSSIPTELVLLSTSAQGTEKVGNDAGNGKQETKTAEVNTEGANTEYVNTEDVKKELRKCANCNELTTITANGDYCDGCSWE